MSNRPHHPSPLYAQTAAPGEPGRALAGTRRCHVAVIGAGITGLSAALHLAEAGRSVVVLDRHEPGWGASGRNGGQVNPGLKPDPDQVAARFGGMAGAARVATAWAAPDLVFDLIGRLGIACEAARGGTLRAAAGLADAAALRALAAGYAAHGLRGELLDADAVAARTGSRQYRMALWDPRGGQINPLAYARGLARAARERGAQLFADSAAERLTRDGTAWRIESAGGALVADRVVLATNGYTDRLWPGLARSVVPLYSAIIASAPLPTPAREAILARREVLYETGPVTTYYRVDAAGRLLIGGRSRSRDLSGAASFGFLARHARRLWPDHGPTAWTHGWNGQLAMTTDHYPHWHEPAAGVIACLGYNGRGVAMATLLGREVARRIDGLGADALLLPPTPIRPIPLHRFWKLGVAWEVGRLRMLEERRRRRGG